MSASLRRLSILALLATGLAGVVRGQVVTEFPIPSAGARPAGIAAGPDGNLWFTEDDKIGRITPDGVVTEFGEAPGGPTSIAGGPSSLWFTEYYDASIGQILTSGVIREYPISGIASSLAVDHSGNLWFTEPYDNRIGRLAGGVAKLFAIPFDCAPAAIAAGPGADLWFTCPSGDQIGRISPSGDFAHFRVPTAGSGLAGIAAGPDRNLWFTEGTGGRIGRITTTGQIEEYALPAGSRPDAIVAGADGNLWFTQVARGGIGRMTTAGEFIGWVRTPTPGGVAMGIAAGPDGNVWITESAGKIARIAPGQTSSCVEDDVTLCLNGGRFQVRAEWQAPSQGTSGRGKADPLTDDTGTFWFFEASSVELVVKVLDACSSSGHTWVFAGGLTNTGVTVTVTDTQMDKTKTYTNTAGNAFEPIQDTEAFSTCP